MKLYYKNAIQSCRKYKKKPVLTFYILSMLNFIAYMLNCIRTCPVLTIFTDINNILIIANLDKGFVVEY